MLPRPLFKYLHQVIASGPGEEIVRAEAWKARNAARGLTVAQATGRRAHRVWLQKRRVRQTAVGEGSSGRSLEAAGESAPVGFRMPAVATREQAAVAALPWVRDGDAGAAASKAAALVAAGDAYYVRRADQKARSAVIARTLASPTAAALASQLKRSKAVPTGTGVSGVAAP